MKLVTSLEVMLERYRMPARPRWDAERPLYYAIPPRKEGDPWPMRRFFPTINGICEPLLGHSERDLKTGKITGVRYPRMARRYAMYREALELVAIVRRKDDLLTLAMYRRQVSQSHLSLDLLFLALGEDMGLTPPEWERIAVRMPHDSPIENVCWWHARMPSVPKCMAVVRELVLPLAAE